MKTVWPIQLQHRQDPREPMLQPVTIWGRTLAIILTCLWICLGSGIAFAESNPTPPNFKIAFIGEQGLGREAESVLNLINSERSNLVMHQGDFDYLDRPDRWKKLIRNHLDPNIRLLAVLGNHEESRFYGEGGYQEVIRDHADGLTWNGEIGVQYSLIYEGIHLVFTAPGLLGRNSEEQAAYVESQLANSSAIWRISSWHLLQHAMQSGKENDEAGWPIYETSRRMGAIIATAHERAYSRTHLLRHMENLDVASTGSPLILTTDDPRTTDNDEGRSFAFVSGLGGLSIRSQSNNAAHFATVYTSNQGAKNGALFGVFHYGGNPRLARFYFKNIDGEVIDDFTVLSSVGEDPPKACKGSACQCNNRIDDDGDGFVDFPEDPGCENADDASEENEGTSCNEDIDEDGSPCSVDCDDANPSIFPGSVDLCDGLDNDCDRSIDEDFVETPTNCGVGACSATGSILCVNGRPTNICRPEPGSSSDATCDGIDDDCDGTVDQDYVVLSTRCGMGQCSNTGELICLDGSSIDSCKPLMPLTSVDTFCDGLDEDCDGSIDDDFPGSSCETGLFGECSSGISLCIEGEETCRSNFSATRQDQQCNGKDEDCDGEIDEDFVASPCNTGALGVCSQGLTHCDNGRETCDLVSLPSAELCDDGLDNDCDGNSDCSDDDCAEHPICRPK